MNKFSIQERKNVKDILHQEEKMLDEEIRIYTHLISPDKYESLKLSFRINFLRVPK